MSQPPAVLDVLRCALRGDMLDFIYAGGSNPGQRRTAQFIRMWELRDGGQGFRAEHDGRPKLYRVALCADMHIEPVGFFDDTDETTDTE